MQHALLNNNKIKIVECVYSCKRERERLSLLFKFHNDNIKSREHDFLYPNVLNADMILFLSYMQT